MNLATFLFMIGFAPKLWPSFYFFGWLAALIRIVTSHSEMFFVISDRQAVVISRPYQLDERRNGQVRPCILVGIGARERLGYSGG